MIYSRSYSYGDKITVEWPWIRFQAEADLWVMAWSVELDIDFREILCCLEAQGY